MQQRNILNNRRALNIISFLPKSNKATVFKIEMLPYLECENVVKVYHNGI